MLFALNLIFHSSNTFAVSYQNNITTGFTINESISITISNDSISINNLLPGQYADSNSIDITVTTNAPYGYTLTSTVGDTSHNSRNFTHTTDNTEVFTSLDYGTSLDNLSSFDDDKWGYSFSNDNGTTWSSYSGLPLYTDNDNVAILKETKILSTDNNKVTFKIGAKASNNKSSGTYENVINFTAVGNPKHLFMQDIDTWRDTLVTTGDAIVAVDIRDGKEYWVGRQADGKIWMTQNLDFEITSTPLNSNTTDLVAYGTGTGYETDAGYSKSGDVITWTPAATAITANSVTPVSTSTGTVSGLTGWTDNDYAPYSAEGGDVYVYTSNSTSVDTIYTSLSSCIVASHTEAECKHYHRGNYYNWSAAIASNNTNVTELTTQYNTAQNSICPAGWKLPVGQSSATQDATTMQFGNLMYASDIITSISGDSYATNGFSNIRSAPLFFVRSGSIYDTSIYGSGTFGRYWSSSVYTEANTAVRFVFSTSTSSINYTNRYAGLSIRCVARDPIYYMQDVAKWENKIPSTGDSIIAVDKRDGKEYWVGRQADGNIWMTQNLDFEITGEALTSDTTDLVAYGEGTGYTNEAGYTKNDDIIKWFPVATAITSERVVPVSTSTNTVSGINGWVNNEYVPYSAEGGDVYVNPSVAIYTSLADCVDAGYSNEAECKHYHRGNYYNWNAAIASNNTNVAELKTNHTTAQNSICPAGWRLPIGAGGDTFSKSNTEFAYLFKQSDVISDYPNSLASYVSYSANGRSIMRANPLFFTRSGYVFSKSLYYPGANGYYWSSSVLNGTSAYNLYFGANTVYPAGYSSRYYGYNIRCLARKPYMQDVARWESKIPNAGDSLVAVDRRDNKEYWVTRLADGKIWMTQNLDFNLDNTKTLTSKDTDLTSFNVGGYTEANGYSKNGDVISWTPANNTIDATNMAIDNYDPYISDWPSSNYFASSVDVGERYVDGVWYDPYTDCSAINGDFDEHENCENHISNAPYESNGVHGALGNYYNWTAAIATNNSNVAIWKSSTLSNIANNPQNSICPAGWRLPTVSSDSGTLEDSTNEFARLNYLYNNNLTNTDFGLFQSPIYLSRAGGINGAFVNVGQLSYYWSSTIYNDYYVYYLYAPTTDSAFKESGAPIRCVAR